MPAFIASLRFFFLATADAEGRPDCSFKGGDPGFVRVLAPDLLAFPDYDGNGMFKSLGNIRANPHVGLLFIDMEGKPKRLRVNGTAEVVLDDPLLPEFEGAQALVRVTPVAIFPNCPRYIPPHAGGGAFALRAALRRGAGGAGVEGLRELRGRGAAAPCLNPALHGARAAVGSGRGEDSGCRRSIRRATPAMPATSS